MRASVFGASKACGDVDGKYVYALIYDEFYRQRGVKSTAKEGYRFHFYILVKAQEPRRQESLTLKRDQFTLF